MVDTFSAEYGWTIDEILELTILQAAAMLEQISVRKHNEYAAQAALHGHKMKAKEKFKPAQELSNKEADAVDAGMAKIMEQIKAD